MRKVLERYHRQENLHVRGLKDIAPPLTDADYKGRVIPPLDPRPVVSRPTIFECHEWWELNRNRYAPSVRFSNPTDEWLMAEYERAHGIEPPPLCDPVTGRCADRSK